MAKEKPKVCRVKAHVDFWLDFHIPLRNEAEAAGAIKYALMEAGYPVDQCLITGFDYVDVDDDGEEEKEIES